MREPWGFYPDKSPKKLASELNSFAKNAPALPKKARKMKILIILLLPIALVAAERIELVTGGNFDPSQYQSLLQREGRDQQVVECHLETFRGLEKKHSFWGRLIEKILPSKVKIDPALSKIVFMNVPYGVKRKIHLDKLPKEKLILFMWEPPIRLREMYAEKVQSCFSRIYTFRDDLVDGKTYFKFYYPVRRPMLTKLPTFHEKKFCTMIVGATCDKSQSHANELYSERIKAIRFFESEAEESFEFYGRNWDPTAYPSYRGPIDDKLSANKNYKYTICYENCRDLPGYITEKIFDCFAAGSIPVYWGASNIEEYIPRTCYIDRRDFETLDELYVHLKALTEEEYEAKLTAIRTYLESEASALFSPENYDRIFLEAISN
jgi:alpha(1,3/1,4) fucosyltransferase